MTSTLRLAILSEFTDLRQSVEGQLEEFSADAGFVAYLALKFGFDKQWKFGLDLSDLKYPREFSAYGYAIARGAPSELCIKWKTVVEREIIGRNFVTPDRSTFIYQPLEVLGLALGLDTIGDHEGLKWLARQVECHDQDGSVPGLFFGLVLRMAEVEPQVAEFGWNGKDCLSACYYFILSSFVRRNGIERDVQRAERMILNSLVGGSIIYGDKLSESVVFFTYQKLLKDSLREHLADDGTSAKLIDELKKKNEDNGELLQSEYDFQAYYWKRYANAYVLSCRILLSISIVLFGMYWSYFIESSVFGDFELFGLNGFGRDAIPIIIAGLTVVGLNWEAIRVKLFGLITSKIAKDRNNRYMRLKKHWLEGRAK
jgi:hypothetical protein